LLSRWVHFKSWWNFNSIKLGWRAVGMHLIGRSMFFRVYQFKLVDFQLVREKS
jgi:hypothetical protein